MLDLFKFDAPIFLKFLNNVFSSHFDILCGTI